MTEIKSLFDRGRRFVKSAELLIKDKDYESAVSRSYYAMFFAVEALLLSKGRSFSSHKAVISAFNEDFVKSGVFKKELSKALIRAFEKRQVSDYESSFSIKEKEAKEILESARSFIAAVEEYMIEQGFQV